MNCRIRDSGVAQLSQAPGAINEYLVKLSLVVLYGFMLLGFVAEVRWALCSKM